MANQSLIHPDLSIQHLVMFLTKTGVIKGDGWTARTLLIPEETFFFCVWLVLFSSLYVIISFSP